MLFNVRLGPEEERIVKGLRRARVNVSALMRKAIREASTKIDTRSPQALLKEILAEIPVNRRQKAKRPQLDDRRAVRTYIRGRLTRR